MGELLKAQQAGSDLEPHSASAEAAKLPAQPFSKTQLPGHAAWIDGDWKLHRIAGKGAVRWELYDLAKDPNERNDLYDAENKRVAQMKAALENWQKSVVGSLNGEDYLE